jgi:hypothetical protein
MFAEHSDVKFEIGHVLFIVDPESESLQSDLRFAALMNKVGFTEP